MYLHYLLGLGGWVGAASDEDAGAAKSDGGPEAPARAAPRTRGRRCAGPTRDRCCRREPELRG